MIASAVESQSTAGPTAIGTPTTTTGSDDTTPIARQPPIGIETAAATNPTDVGDQHARHAMCSRRRNCP